MSTAFTCLFILFIVKVLLSEDPMATEPHQHFFTKVTCLFILSIVKVLLSEDPMATEPT
jgi:hypothetical protein